MGPAYQRGHSWLQRLNLLAARKGSRDAHAHTHAVASVSVDIKGGGGGGGSGGFMGGVVALPCESQQCRLWRA